MRTGVSSRNGYLCIHDTRSTYAPYVLVWLYETMCRIFIVRVSNATHASSWLRDFWYESERLGLNPHTQLRSDVPLYHIALRTSGGATKKE